MAVADLPRLRVTADFRCYPTWVFPETGGSDNPDPADLGLPTDLAADLNAWSDEFDAIFPEDDPTASIFPSPDAERAFNDRGLALARRTAAASADRFAVTYYPTTGGPEITVPAP